MEPLRTRHCAPCTSATPRLTTASAHALAVQIPDWQVTDERLVRRFVFPEFVAAMAFVNRLAAIAEREGHHPDFAVHYRQVDVTIWTHAVGGLTENDFILAAHVEAAIEET